MSSPRKNVQDLRASSKLAVQATLRVTEVVEDMHRTIASGPPILGSPLAMPATLYTRLVYGHIRGVTRLVGLGVDQALSRLSFMLDDTAFGSSSAGPQREALLAALNGVVGDYLKETESPLAIDMSFREHGKTFSLDVQSIAKSFPNASRKLLVLLHGSSMNDLQWQRNGHDHGKALADEFGYTPVYLHYNSGLHVSENGRELAGLLEALVSGWPVEVEEINLLGHSMGGLLARSVLSIGEWTSSEDSHNHWRKKVRRLVCLGTPHHGSPLERSGSWVQNLLGITAYSAPIGRLARLRSAGVTDLRFGFVRDEDWQERDRFQLGSDPRRDLLLPKDVDCYAMAASTSLHGSNKIAGDGLVPVESALGRHLRKDLHLGFEEANTFIAFGTTHLGLLNNAEVYAKLRHWFRP